MIQSPYRTLSILLLMLLMSPLAIFSQQQQQKLISYKLVQSYTVDNLDSTWKANKVSEAIIPIERGVDIYELIYWSAWFDGTPVRASALYFVPQDYKEPAPLMLYHHGTRIYRKRSLKLGGQNAICVAFATDGYLVAHPDYLGLGKGEKFHLYQHSGTEAQASIDLLFALEEMDSILDLKRDGQLYLTGYSQGGHSTMAVHRALERDYPERFPVTASSPMSGPYDMSGVQSEVMFDEYSDPAYLPYLFKSYNEVYKVFDGEYWQAFKPPYDSIIRTMMDGNHKINAINKHLLPKPVDMIREEVLQAYLNNPDFSFKEALKDNDVYDWKPEAPMQICYCKSDEQVNYRNALVAYDAMKENGAERVVLRNSGAKYGHIKCGLFAAVHTKMWFDSFRKGSDKGKKGPVFKRLLLGLAKLSIKP